MKKVTNPDLLSKLNETTSPQTDSLGDAIRKSLFNRFVGDIGRAAQPAAEMFAPKSVAKGFTQAVPRTFMSGARNISQLLGSDFIPEIKQQSPQSAGETFGKLLGQGAAYGVMAEPIASSVSGLIPDAAGSLLPKILGGATAGATLSPRDERIEGALEFAAPVLAYKAVEPLAKFGTKAIKSSFHKVKPEETYNKLIDLHDSIENRLGNIFEFVGEQAKKRGVDNVKQILPEAYSAAREHGIKSQAFKNLVDKAEKGNYDSIRRLYSRISDFERKADKAGQWEKVEEFQNIKDLINQGLSEHFEQAGHKDLTQWLDAARKGYRQLKNTFVNRQKGAIKNLIGENREFPETLKPLMKKSIPIQNLLDAAPEVKSDVMKAIQKNEVAEALSKMKKRGAASIGLGLLSQILRGNKKTNELD